MRKRTVRKGVRLLIAAVMLLTVATFYHEQVGDLFIFSSSADQQFVFFSLFWGGMIGMAGILVVIIGLVRTGASERPVSLLPSTLLLMVAVAIFFLLIYRSFVSTPDAPRLRPGETIVI